MVLWSASRPNGSLLSPGMVFSSRFIEKGMKIVSCVWFNRTGRVNLPLLDSFDVFSGKFPIGWIINPRWYFTRFVIHFSLEWGLFTHPWFAVVHWDDLPWMIHYFSMKFSNLWWFAWHFWNVTTFLIQFVICEMRIFTLDSMVSPLRKVINAMIHFITHDLVILDDSVIYCWIEFLLLIRFTFVGYVDAFWLIANLWVGNFAWVCASLWDLNAALNHSPVLRKIIGSDSFLLFNMSLLFPMIHSRTIGSLIDVVIHLLFDGNVLMILIQFHL